jgi:hypothetical protein
VIITSVFKPIGVAIGINENLLDEYLKYKWKKQVLRCSINKDEDDNILNFDCKNFQLTLNNDCKSQNRYKIIRNLFNLEYNIYQWV